MGGSEELLGQAYPTNSILSDPLLLCEVGYDLGCGLSLDHHVGDAKAVGSQVMTGPIGEPSREHHSIAKDMVLGRKLGGVRCS